MFKNSFIKKKEEMCLKLLGNKDISREEGCLILPVNVKGKSLNLLLENMPLKKQQHVIAFLVLLLLIS